MIGARIVAALDAAAVRALGEQAGRSGAPPVKWLILRVLGDVTSATTAELTQALSVRDGLYRADGLGAGVAGTTVPGDRSVARQDLDRGHL